MRQHPVHQNVPWREVIISEDPWRRIHPLQPGCSLHFLYLANAEIPRGWSSLLKIDTYLSFPESRKLTGNTSCVSSPTGVKAQRRGLVSAVERLDVGREGGWAAGPALPWGSARAAALSTATSWTRSSDGAAWRQPAPRLELRTLIYSQGRYRSPLQGFCLLSLTLYLMHSHSWKQGTHVCMGDYSWAAGNPQGRQGDSSYSWVASAAAENQAVSCFRWNLGFSMLCLHSGEQNLTQCLIRRKSMEPFNCPIYSDTFT